MSKLTDAQLEQQVLALAPWHHRVHLNDVVSTAIARGSAGQEHHAERTEQVVMIDDHDEFVGLVNSIYPGGIVGKSFLEAACNCGAYSIWFKQLGGGRVTGFDVRQHWIDQAQFLARHVLDDPDDVSFHLADLYDLPSLGIEPVDVGFFKGIFYHLPDPIAGLKVVADRTRELLLVNSATRGGGKPALRAAQENVESLMAGVHGLSWFPTGPETIIQILRWLGFVEFRVLFWHRFSSPRVGLQRGLARYVKNLVKRTGRTEVLAARSPGFFEDFDRAGFDRRYRAF